jgi:hypothetical protein
MALVVTPKESPADLLKQIKATMSTSAIETWSMDSDGDFTHTPTQWKHKGWFRPTIDGSVLVFKFLGNTAETTTKEIYGVYHGRFLEMLLVHFDLQFTDAQASALPSRGDQITRLKK